MTPPLFFDRSLSFESQHQGEPLRYARADVPGGRGFAVDALSGSRNLIQERGDVRMAKKGGGKKKGGKKR
jgi:hypothetical protein